MSESQYPELKSRIVRDPVWDSISFCICRTGPDHSITRLSPGFIKMVMGQTQEHAPIEIPPLIHPEDRGTFIEELEGILSNGNIMEKRPVRLVTPDGRVLLLEVSGERTAGAGEDPGVVLVWWERSDNGFPVALDASEKLDEFTEASKTFISNLFDPVVLLNTEGRIVHVNPPLQEMLDYHRHDLIGSPVAMLFEREPDRIKESMLKFAKLMRTGRMRDVSYSWRNRDGRKIPVTMSGSVIRSDTGELIGMVLVGRDERKNALLADLEKKNRELAEAYMELKNLDRMKDDVLSLVGHELRAPLANILGYSEFLKEWDLAEEEKENFVRIIYQESQRLSRLVNDILDLTRMEAGRMSYHYVTDSVNRVVQAAMDSLSADAENKRIRLEAELDDQVENMEFDPDRIQQVVTNIVHNAIKFTEPGKRIKAWTENVEGGVRVSIADQGAGIDPEDAHKVFEKFEQIEQVDHHSEGAGLGMPIAKQIVEEGHGGKIWFESPGRNQGTVFRFVIPERRREP